MHRIFAAIFVFMASLPAVAQAPEDVAIISMVSGDVRMISAGGESFAVRPFNRVRQNDRFSVPPGSALRILYLRSGRAELWTGPVQFRAGSDTSETPLEPTSLKKIPDSVRERLALMSRVGQFGGSTIRARPIGSLDASRLEAIRESYTALRSQFPDADAIPELYMATAVGEYISAAKQ